MDPAERVSLIQSVYATLSGVDWPPGMVEAALAEFGADDRARLLDSVRSLSDAGLIGLDAYLHRDERNAELLPGEQGPWQGDLFRLFVSDTSAHKQLAGDLRNAMLQVGIDCFVAHTTIEPTREWQDEIERALRTCHALLALVTDDFIGSRWCDQEVGVCYGIGTLVVPVRIGADPYGFIGRFQAVSYAPQREHVTLLRDRLFDLLGTHPQTQSRMIDPIVRRFAQSWSWDNTRAAWPAVKALPRGAWTDDRVALMRSAARDSVEVQAAGFQNDGEWYQAPALIEKHFKDLGIAAASDETPSV